MTMPLNLVLVRHGESEGNVATARSKAGDDRDYQGEFLRRHNSRWRLTEKGIWQAETAGEWIRENIGSTFGRYYTSWYNRAMETAAHLKLPSANWFIDINLRERDWGAFDVMSRQERATRFSKELERRKIEGFFWRPPNGESDADLCLRATRKLDTLHRECEDMAVIMVCHGEVIWAFRVLIERLTPRAFEILEASKDPKDRIHNCQVLHYTRVNPETGKVSPYLNWMRSVCPTDPSLSTNDWQPIIRRSYTNEDLLAEVNRTRRLLSR